MNCNLATFQPIKYETVQYNLIGPERWVHIDSVHDDKKRDFVQTLIKSVKDKSKQISMTMKEISIELLESSIEFFEGIYAVDVKIEWSKPRRRKALDHLHIFNNIHTVHLNGILMQSISGGLEDIVNLEVSGCCNVRFISNINNSKTLRHLSIIRCSSLTHLDFPLTDIKKIQIKCHYFTCLGGGLSGDIEDVTLITSARISLLTANNLAKIAPKLRHLYLAGCFAHDFQDYHPFQSIPSLRLSGSARHYPLLFPVFQSETLRLFWFNLTSWNSSTTSSFESLQVLELSHCKGILTLPDISSLKVLTLEYVFDLQTIPTLMNLQELTIRGCGVLVSIASLQPALRKVVIYDTARLSRFLFESPCIEEVTLINCHALADVSTLRNVPKLRISHCDGVKSLAGLAGSSKEEDRRSISLEYLKNVHDLSGLNHIHSLKISGMIIGKGISDIDHLEFAACPLFTTKDLKNIRFSLSLGRCVGLLKLENLRGIPLIEI